jgi:hypothetical protein
VRAFDERRILDESSHVSIVGQSQRGVKLIELASLSSRPRNARIIFEIFGMLGCFAAERRIPVCESQKTWQRNERREGRG